MKKLIHQGFTLVETVILVAVTAILSTLLIPDIVQFFQFYETRGEKDTLYKIKQAIDIYENDWGELPQEALWYQDIAPYTDLTENQIRFDTWLRERQYRMFTYQYNAGEEFRGQAISADYAIVMTYGQDSTVDADTVLDGAAGIIDLEPLPLLTDDLGGMPLLESDALLVFSNLTMAGDDQIIVYTNLPKVVKRMEITDLRMDTLKAAIDNYAGAKKSADPTPTNVLYRPPSFAPAVPDPIINYDVDMVAEVTAFTGGASRFNTVQTAAVDSTALRNARRTEMISLVRFLGLIDSYCCNALERYDDDADPATPSIEVPFLYYSNPRGTDIPAPDCNIARPTGADNNIPFLPVRIMREPQELNADINNCG